MRRFLFEHPPYPVTPLHDIRNVRFTATHHSRYVESSNFFIKRSFFIEVLYRYSSCTRTRTDWFWLIRTCFVPTFPGRTGAPASSLKNSRTGAVGMRPSPCESITRTISRSCAWVRLRPTLYKHLHGRDKEGVGLGLRAGKRSHTGQTYHLQIDHLDHVVDHLEPNPPLWDAVQDVHMPTQRARSLRLHGTHPK